MFIDIPNSLFNIPIWVTGMLAMPIGVIISATITSIIIGFGVSGIMAGASYLYQRFTQKPLDMGDNSFDINPVDTRMHLPVVYGRARLGGGRIFTKTELKNINDIHTVYACVHGEIGGFEKIWLDNEIVVDYSTEAWIDEYNLKDWDLKEKKGGDWDTAVRITRNNGEFNPTVFADLQTEFGTSEWTNNHKGAGVASVAMRMHLSSYIDIRNKMFPGGFPSNVSFKVKGLKIQDIRQLLSVNTCESVWSYSNGSVTQSTITGKVGTNAVRATIGAGAGVNTLLFADNFTAKNLSTYNAIACWIRISIDTNAADLQLLIDDTADCASPLRTIDLPHFDANKWKRVVVNYDTDLVSDITSIISLGVKQVTDIGACTIDIDDVWATVKAFDYISSRGLVEDCEDTWNEISVNGVTLSTTTGKHGNAIRASVRNVGNDTILMTEAIGSQSFAAYTAIQFWIRSSIDTTKGDLQFLIDNTAQCVSPLLTLDIPALKKDTWRQCELEFPNPSVLTGIVSLGIKINSTVNGSTTKRLGHGDANYTIDIDDVYAIERITIGDNPALCAYDYITNPVYGDGAEPSEMDETSFITEANYCDEIVAGPINPPPACKAKRMNETGLLKPKSYYQFKVSYVRGDGIESKLGTASNIVKTSKNNEKLKILLTNIPIAESDNVKQRKIYATKGLGTPPSANVAVFYLYKTINNNKDTTLEFNIDDSDLTVVAPVNTSITKNMKRFTCNGIIDTSREIKTNLEDMLTCCRGNIYYEGTGKYVMFIKKPTTAETTITLTEDNIIGDWKWTMPAIKETANIVKASYINKHKEYQTDYITWPKARETNQYLIDDNYFENLREINLNFTINSLRAKHIAMVILKETRDMIKASCKCKEEALKLRVGSLVNVTHSTPAWVAKSFWVEGITILQDGNIGVSLTSYTAANYTYDTITEDDTESTSEDIPSMDEDDNYATDCAGTTGNELGDPPAIRGLQIIHNRGNELNVFGSDFEIRWDDVTERKDMSEYAITAYTEEDYYRAISNQSSEGIRYLIELYFVGISSAIKINNISVKDKLAYSEITSKTTFKFSLADNIEAMKKLWSNYSTHASYNTYYGVPQRQIAVRIATLNAKNRQSVFVPIILSNPAPDMNGSNGNNTTPVLKALKSGIRVQFIHPYQEYDISHFMIQYAEDSAFTVNLKKVRVPSAITVNSTDDELDSTQYKVDIDGLDPKKTYYVRVRPHDTYGAGTYSGTASIVPGLTDDDASGDIVAPGTVTGLNFSVLTNGNLRGSWTLLADIDISEYIYDWRAVNDITAVNPPTLTEIENEITAGGKACYGIVSSVMLKGSVEATTKNQFIIQSPKVGYNYFFKVRARNTSRKLGNWPASWTTHSTAVPGLVADDLPQKWAMYKFLGTVTAVDATHVSVSITGGSGSTGLKKKTNAGSSNIALNNLASTAFTGTQFIAYVGTATLAIKTEAQMDADSSFVAIAKIVEAPSGKCNVLMMLSATDFNISAYGGAFNQVDTLILTGTTIQTAASGARIVLSTDFNIYDASSLRISIDTTNGLQIRDASNNIRARLAMDGSGWFGAASSFSWTSGGNVSLNGAVITDSSIDGSSKIADSTIISGKIVSLIANKITAGTITSQAITLAGDGCAIKSGQTAYDTGAGFWLGLESATSKFSIGNSGGSKLTWDGSTFTVQGKLIASTASVIDGSYVNVGIIPVLQIPDLSAAKITTGTLSADRIGAASITAGKLNVATISSITADLGTITAGTITGATLQTASSGKRFVVSSATNEAEFYGDRGDATIEKLASIGINQDGSDYIIGDFGNLNSGNSRIALRARSKGVTAVYAKSTDNKGIEAYSTDSQAIYAVSTNSYAILATSNNFYGGGFQGNATKSPIRILPLSSPPSSGLAGDIFYHSGLNKLFCHNGTDWQPLF